MSQQTLYLLHWIFGITAVGLMAYGVICQMTDSDVRKAGTVIGDKRPEHPEAYQRRIF